MSAVERGIYLLEVDAWIGSSVQTLRLASQTISSRPTDMPANVVYNGAIMDAGKLSRYAFSAPGAAASYSSGGIELSNGNGKLDAWVDYGFDGRPFKLKWLPSTTSMLNTAATIFAGTVERLDASRATKSLRLQFKDRLSDLDKPLLTTRYAGTTNSAGATAEGDTDLKDQIKPAAWGRITNAPAKLANRFNLLYQFAANSVAALTVYDGGVALTATTDYPTLSSLVAATVPAGSYATSRQAGIASLGGSPAFAVTADIIEGATAADRTAAAVAQRVLSAFGVSSSDIDTASFTALQAASSTEIGILISDETTCLAVVNQVLSSIGATLIATAAGQFRAVRLTAPVAGTVFTMRDIGNDADIAIGAGAALDGLPAWSVSLDCDRVWQVQSAADLAGIVSDAQKAYLATEYRTATASDASVKTAHPSAQSISLQTALSAQEDASTEATRLLDLYKTRRDRVTISVPFAVAQSIEIGDAVTIKIPRFGWNGGKNFRVVGHDMDFQRRRIGLKLWG